MHTIGIDVLQGVQQAIKEAEQNWRALVIWQTEPPFSAGANLQKATERPKPKTRNIATRPLRRHRHHRHFSRS
jgi:3-hydroxyacyl-CoA dehydrogenase